MFVVQASRLVMRARVVSAIVCVLSCTTPASAITYVCPLVYGQSQYYPASTAYDGDGRAVNESDLGPLLTVISHASLGLGGPDGQGCPSSARTGRADDVPVHAFRGYREGFRLIIRRDGRLIPYEVWQRPQMKTGADILDIAGRVSQVTIERSRAVPPDDSHSQRWRVSVTDKDQVRDIIHLVLAGAVRRGQPDLCAPEKRGAMATLSLLSYALIFHMIDGTIVLRPYWPGSDTLTGPILVPDLRNLMDEIFASQGIRFDDCPPNSRLERSGSTPAAQPERWAAGNIWAR